MSEKARLELYSMGSEMDVLRFFLDRSKEQNGTGSVLDQAIRETAVHLPGQGRVTIEPFLGLECIFVQPLHQRQMEPCPLIQELRRVQVKIAESWHDERPIWDRGEWFGWSVQELLRFWRGCFIKVGDGACSIDHFTCA